MKKNKIGIIIGSLRRESWNRKIAELLISMAPSSLDMEIIEINQLSLYNQDEDENPPKFSTAFKAKIKAVDGLLFLTPEYNRSLPGVLKNALDVASRPYGQSAWDGKPGAIISVSPGAIGGFGANHHLRQILMYLNVPCLNQPEIYLSNVAALFDKDGKFNNQNTKEFLGKFLDAFADWVAMFQTDKR
ncbi:MAG: NAD(P)H-dependent oxidoreductase [Legionella sp.]|nr:NAD(P)H-dependent oxidoreductase [Legionella sp.]